MKMNKMKEKKLWIVLSAGAMDYRVDGIYDSMEQILEKFKEDWDDTLTMENITDYDWLSDNELKIESGTYYQSKEVMRDEKIDTIFYHNDGHAY